MIEKIFFLQFKENPRNFIHYFIHRIRIPQANTVLVTVLFKLYFAIFKNKLLANFYLEYDGNKS